MVTMKVLVYALFKYKYHENPITRPPMVLLESCLNSDQVSLMRPIYIENCIMELKQVVLIARVVFILSGLYNGTLLYYNSIINIVMLPDF